MRYALPLRHLRVAHKLLGSFGIVCLLLLGVGGTGLIELANSRQRLEAMYDDSTRAIGWLGEVRGDVHAARALAPSLILHSQLTDTAEVLAQIKRLDEDVDAAWARYSATDGTGRETERAALAKSLAEYRQIRDTQLVPAAEANDAAAYLKIQSDSIEPLTGTITIILDALGAKEDAVAHAAMTDAETAANRAQWIVTGLIVVALLLAVALVLLLSRGLARPLGQTVVVLEGLAEGRLDQRLTVGGRDEVGRMAEALNTALDRLTTALRGAGDNVGALGTSARQLTDVAGQMNDSAQRSAKRADAVAHATGTISENIATVAAGADEIGFSIAEIARSTSDAAGVAARAATLSADASATLHNLRESSAEIASVVKIITNVAAQTNLLALNATIEAARAGDAGRGFAVVAGEVKQLAQETAKATQHITARVGAIQTDSGAAVAAIAEISAVIDQVNATQTAIAAAVEEQTATTTEMGRNVNEVADSTHGITTNVDDVARAAAATTAAAGHTARAADDLARIARDLESNLATFRY
jgi:methyl-accepting chemotaxis protein